jgi:hypothetical protein
MNEKEAIFEPDEVDALLRRALQARPQPHPSGDLASRAMQLARASDRAAVTLAQLNRQRRWVRLLTTAAIVLVAVVLFVGGRRTVQLAPLSFGSTDSAQTETTSADATSTDTASADSSGTTSQSSEARTTALLAAGICCGAILLLALRRAFEPDPRFLESWHLPRAC